MQKFFDAHYYPRNLAIIAIVGDVNPDQVKQLAQVYFGRYKAKKQRTRKFQLNHRKSQAGSNITTALAAVVYRGISPSIN